jgi:class 3 adenylate cyclase
VVQESDGDLMGDGVNIAARLEGFASRANMDIIASGEVSPRGKRRGLSPPAAGWNCLPMETGNQ